MAAETTLIRLNKYLAEAGVASRRRADQLIRNGEVLINGKRTFELGIKIDPKLDVIKIKDRIIRPPTHKVYYMLNKPPGVVTSLSDPEGRPTVKDFFPKEKIRIFPVGRLDWNTEGLLLMTNDGDFSNQISHPKSHIAKTYVAKIEGKPTETQLQKLTRGITIPEGRVKATEVARMDKKDRKTEKVSEKYTWVRITVTEGKNQQVRKMFMKLGYSVVRLIRVQVGGLKLGALEKGQHRPLSAVEVLKIFKVDEKVTRQSSTKRLPEGKTET